MRALPAWSSIALAVLSMAAGAPAPQDAGRDVLIFAAASLKTALDEIAGPCRTATGVGFRASYAASSTLAKQLEQGAPADLFISADLDWMDDATTHGVIDASTRVNLLGNDLVLIAPRASPVSLQIAPGFGLAAALQGGRLAVGDPAAVPAGLYAKAALASLGVWDDVSRHLAPAENVRAALGTGLARRSTARHRLSYGRHGRSRRSRGRRVSGKLAPANHLSGGAHDPRVPRRLDRARLPARPRRAHCVRAAGLPHERPAGAMTGWSASDLAIVGLSLKVATVGTLLSLPFAVAAAIVLARGRSWAWRLLDVVVHLPLVLPPVVTGYVLLLAFGRRGAIGALLERTIGVTFAFRWTGAALAAAVMGFPLMVRAIRLAVEGVDRHLEEAAATLGASPWWTLVTVTLPLALPGVLSGMIVAFAKALGEFGATITFVSNIPGETQTLALAIYSLTQTPGGDLHALRLVWLSLGVSVAALLASEALARRIGRRR